MTMLVKPRKSLPFVFALCLAILVTLSACGMFEDDTREFKAYKVSSPDPQVASSAPVTTMPSAVIAQHPNVPQLFVEPLANDRERIERLEKTVQKLYESLHMNIPAMGSLNSLEENVQALDAPLELHTVSDVTVPVHSPSVELVELGGDQRSAVSNHIQAPVLKNKPALKYTVDGIQDIRVSQNGGTTRVVLDSNKKINYNFDYDGTEGIILLMAPNTDVAGNFNSRAGKSKHIRALNISKHGSNTDIIMTLSAPAEISKPVTIAPNNDSPYYRYFFDIKS